MFISGEEPALNHIFPNVGYIGSSQGTWVEPCSSWEGTASSSGGSDLATYVVASMPQSISIIYGWLNAIPQQVHCQDLESRKSFSTYFQPKTTMVSLGIHSITFSPRTREMERHLISEDTFQAEDWTDNSAVFYIFLQNTQSEWQHSVSPLLNPNMNYTAFQVSSSCFHQSWTCLELGNANA